MAGPILSLLGEEEKERWKKTIHSRTLRSMHQLAVLGQITGALGKAGIEVLTMKGPVLAYELFGNLGERHSSDLDLLARKEDIREIIKILGSKGFVQMYPKAGLSARQWDYYTRYKKDLGLYNKKENLLVELHYNIENYLGLSEAELEPFFQQTEELTMGGGQFRCMNRHRDFLYLTFHGAVHQYRRLFWLRDIAEVIKSWDLDHQKVLDDAKGIGSDRMLGLSLLLARDLFHAEVPTLYLSYLEKNRKVLKQLKEISMSMILGPEFPSLRQKARHHLFMLHLKPEFRHYLRTLREIINRQYIGKFLGGH